MVGLPTLAALEQGIAVIAVREKRNRMKNELEELPFAPGKLFIVENYLEAVGIMTALKSGVAPSSVRRPLAEKVLKLKLLPGRRRKAGVERRQFRKFSLGV